MSPTSPLHHFLDQSEDVLEWVSEWEQRNSTMDAKHVEILVSQWKLMREGAKEHALVFHQMKKAMQELRSNSATLQDRLDALERRLRDDVSHEIGTRVDDLERRLRETMNQEQNQREADVGELRDLLLVEGRKTDERLDALREQLGQEKQVRQLGVEAIQKLLAKETEVLREVKRHIAEETAARERGQGALQDRIDRADRIISELDERQAAMHAALKDNQDRSDRVERVVAELEDRLRADEERLGRLDRQLSEQDERQSSQLSALKSDQAADVMMLQGRLGAVEQELRKERGQREATLDKLKDLVSNDKDVRERDLEALKDKLEQDLRREKGQREAAIDRLTALVGTDQHSRERDLGAIKELLMQEKVAREKLVRSLQELLKREADLRAADVNELRQELGSEKAARERAGDVLRAVLDDKLWEHRSSLQERVDHLLRLLNDGAGGMVQSWRDADRPSHAPLSSPLSWA